MRPKGPALAALPLCCCCCSCWAARTRRTSLDLSGPSVCAGRCDTFAETGQQVGHRKEEDEAVGGQDDGRRFDLRLEEKKEPVEFEDAGEFLGEPVRRTELDKGLDGPLAIDCFAYTGPVLLPAGGFWGRWIRFRWMICCCDDATVNEEAEPPEFEEDSVSGKVQMG